MEGKKKKAKNKKTSLAEYVIVSFHVSRSLRWQLRVSACFRGSVSSNRNGISGLRRGEKKKFSPDSLHITWLSLLSPQRYNPGAVHRLTPAHTPALTPVCRRQSAHPPAAQTSPAEATPAPAAAAAVPDLPFCSLFRIQLADDAWSPLGCVAAVFLSHLTRQTPRYTFTQFSHSPKCQDVLIQFSCFLPDGGSLLAGPSFNVLQSSARRQTHLVRNKAFVWRQCAWMTNGIPWLLSGHLHQNRYARLCLFYNNTNNNCPAQLCGSDIRYIARSVATRLTFFLWCVNIWLVSLL